MWIVLLSPFAFAPLYKLTAADNPKDCKSCIMDVYFIFAISSLANKSVSFKAATIVFEDIFVDFQLCLVGRLSPDHKN